MRPIRCSFSWRTRSRRRARRRCRRAPASAAPRRARRGAAHVDVPPEPQERGQQPDRHGLAEALRRQAHALVVAASPGRTCPRGSRPPACTRCGRAHRSAGCAGRSPPRVGTSANVSLAGSKRASWLPMASVIQTEPSGATCSECGPTWALALEGVLLSSALPNTPPRGRSRVGQLPGLARSARRRARRGGRACPGSCRPSRCARRGAPPGRAASRRAAPSSHSSITARRTSGGGGGAKSGSALRAVRTGTAVLRVVGGVEQRRQLLAQVDGRKPPMRPISRKTLSHSSSVRSRRVPALPCWWQ